MTLRTFGLVAACMLAGTISAGAQNIPDEGKGKKESPGKVEMPSREGGRSARESGAKELTRKPSSGPQKSESSQRGRDRSAQDLPKKQDVQKRSYRAEGEKRKSSSAQKDQPKPERGKPDDKAYKQGKAAQSKPETKPADKSASESKAAPADANKSAEREKSKADEAGRDSSSGTSTGEAGTSSPGKVTEEKKKVDEVKKVQITGERRDRVQAGFRRHGDIKHETNVDVNIFVGTRVPRSWAFAPVPIAVIEVVPEYRGYVFAYVEDEYVICDPDTYEVVAVLPESGSGGTGSGGTYASREGSGTVKCPTDLALSREDREEIIKSIEMTDDVSISGVSVGWSVPSDIDLRPFPPRVVERTSGLGACRYFITNDQIAIVDPDQDEVVLMIEQD